jgi:hypothetical protein
MILPLSGKTISLSLFLVGAAISFHGAVVADGVCDQSGWCRLHLQLTNEPYSTVYIRPIDSYGSIRRVMVRTARQQLPTAINCSNAMLSVYGGPAFQAKPNSVGGEIYESVCLGMNRTAFQQFPYGQGFPVQGVPDFNNLPPYPGGVGVPTDPPTTQQSGRSLFDIIINEIIKPR